MLLYLCIETFNVYFLDVDEETICFYNDESDDDDITCLPEIANHGKS